MWRTKNAVGILFRNSLDFTRREARVSRELVQNLNKDRYSVVLKQVCKCHASWLWVCRLTRLSDGKGCQAKGCVVSLQDVEGQGVAGDVIDVRHGLARNKLIPNKWAVPATRPNIERFGRRVQVNSLSLCHFAQHVAPDRGMDCHHLQQHWAEHRRAMTPVVCLPLMTWKRMQSTDPSLHRRAQGTPAQDLDAEVDAVLKHLSKAPVVSCCSLFK